MPTFFALIAQSVEHAAVNRSVTGSSPVWGAMIALRKGKHIETPCKSRGFSVFRASFGIHLPWQTIPDFSGPAGLEPVKP